MGYDTRFEGKLTVTCQMPIPMLATLQMAVKNTDLEITPDEKSLRWNGMEKTYNMVGQVNIILNNMRQYFPEFGLSGELKASGEDFDDRFYVRIVDGMAQEIRA